MIHIVVLVLIGFNAIFFHPLLSGSNVLVTTGLIQSDLMGFSYPIKWVLAEALNGRGSFPFWVSDIAAGDVPANAVARCIRRHSGQAADFRGSEHFREYV